MKSNQSRAETRGECRRQARSSSSPLVCDFYVLAADNDDDGGMGMMRMLLLQLLLVQTFIVCSSVSLHR